MSNDFRFDYEKYQNKSLSVEKLDQHLEQILQDNGTYLSKITLIIKLGVFGLYLWTRRQLINEEHDIQKQQYERRRASEQAGSISEDDLDQAHRESIQKEVTERKP